MNPDRAYRPEFDQRVIELGRDGKWRAEMALGLVVRPRGAEDRRQAAAGDRLEHSGGQTMADGALTPPPATRAGGAARATPAGGAARATG